MLPERIMLPVEDAPRRTKRIVGLMAYLAKLPIDHAWRLEITEAKSRRTLSQNALLWSLYGEILRKGGESLGGWAADDLHEYCLGEWSGWEKLEGFGRKRLRPLKRSSRLSKSEFTAYLDFIYRRMAEHGIVLDDPEQFTDRAA